FGQTAGYFVSLVHGVVRQAQLWGCDLTEDGYVEDLLLQLRDAWEEYFRSTSDTHYAEDWAAVERSCEMDGLPPSASPPAFYSGGGSGDSGGSMGAGVESPAELEVFSRDGGRVGWDAATNASVSTIPGATYQGRPGAVQKVTLPAGEYRVVLHELADSALAIRDEWSAPGTSGNETVPASATEGRTTSYYVSLAKDSNGNWSRMISPA